MPEASAILIEQQRVGNWAVLTLGSASLAVANAGQYVALRCTQPCSYDPLVRQPLFIAATDARSGTCRLLVDQRHPAFPFVTSQPTGTQLDQLGPLGKGWRIEPTARTLALLGTAHDAAPLFGLAHAAVGRGLAVSVLLGATEAVAAPAPFLLPAAAEYNVAEGADAASAALSLLDDPLIRWADLLAVALPAEQWPIVGQRVQTVRLRWNRDFVQVAVLSRLACCVGVCGVCAVEMRHGQRLACVDGPIFDLRDLLR